MDHDALIQKLLRIEALHAGATTSGERDAAEAARQRILARLAKTRRVEPAVPYRFSISDPWSRQLFIALARRYDLQPYRRYRQRRQTVMVDVPRRFVDETLWPEFEALQAVLQTYLAEVTGRVISEAIHGDVSEAKVRAELG